MITLPTASGFIQARSKIRVKAFKILFDRFNKKVIRINYIRVIGY